MVFVLGFGVFMLIFYDVGKDGSDGFFGRVVGDYGGGSFGFFCV